MRDSREILALLDALDEHPASELEAQDLDFKEWSRRSLADAVALVVEMAICMANGGGGTTVFGVNDKRLGRSEAIRGVPVEIDVNRLKKAVYDSTDPKLTPVFEEIAVPEGTGRILSHAGPPRSAAVHRHPGPRQDPHRHRLPAPHRHAAAPSHG